MEEGLGKRWYGDPKGWGVVATKFFRKGEFITSYHGQLISGKEGWERYCQLEKDGVLSSYMFFLRHNQEEFW